MDTPTTLYARFRIFDSKPAYPTFAHSGKAGNGEVEDYRWELGVLGDRVWADNNSDGIQDPLENLDEFKDQVVIVTEKIDPDSSGKVEFKGADWSARCDTPLAVGARAVIQSVDGITLLVRPEK